MFVNKLLLKFEGAIKYGDWWEAKRVSRLNHWYEMLLI